MEEKKHECQIGVYFDYDDTDLCTANNFTENTSFSNNTRDELLEGKHNFFKFSFCPVCGKKLDWDQIKEQIKNREDELRRINS